jgi:glyceraldehyde 3-phosphate dehydrogenase
MVIEMKHIRMKVGINGMGRIGRLALRAAWARPSARGRPARRQPPGGGAPERTQGRRRGHRPPAAVRQRAGPLARRHCRPRATTRIRIGGRQAGLSAHATAAEIPWGDLGVDVVLECTGKFLTPETLQGHLDRGAKRVIVAAPVKVGDVLNIVVGVNHHLYDPAGTASSPRLSCTTNCLAPVVKVVHEAMGIRHGQITTIHNPTNTNLVVDAPHKDLRRARSAMLSLAPTTTGSATAIALIYPELKGKLNGHAVRVPVLNASLTDCVFELKRETTAEEVNALFAAGRAPGSAGRHPGLRGRGPLVSADYARDTRSSIVDALSTMVTDGTLLKVYAWYDNEMGYACRMVDLACHMQTVGI